MSPAVRMELILWLFTQSWAGVLQVQVARQAGRIEELLDQYTDVLIELESERSQRRQAELRALIAERAQLAMARFVERREQVL